MIKETLQVNGVNAFCAVIAAKCASLLADIDSEIAFWSSIFALIYVFALAVSSVIDVVRKLQNKTPDKHESKETSGKERDNG